MRHWGFTENQFYYKYFLFYLILKINIKIIVKFGTDELSAINIIIHQIFSLIKLVLSRVVQDEYSFTTNKSLDTVPFLNCK
jgi:hypothetical protein